jgi:hypothetical protein
LRTSLIVLLSTTVLLISFLASSTVRAAEVICADTYADANFKVAGAAGGVFEKHFPSGRRPNASTCEAILIRGDIEAGDGAKFLKLMQINHPFVSSVYLASSGGSVEEAIKIGKLIRRDMLDTIAPMPLYPTPSDGVLMSMSEPGTELCNSNIPGSDCHCASSCFLIWAAGASRWGGTIGIHRPSIHSPDFANLPPDRASAIYRQQVILIGQYLADMEIPPKYIGIMTDTASDDIYWIDEEAASMAMPPSIAESMASACGSLNTKETETMYRIRGSIGRKQPVSEEDAMSYKALNEKYISVMQCSSTKMWKYRDSMASIE